MNEKLEKLSRQRAAAEKKLIAAQHRGSGRISFAKRQRDMVCRCLVE
ncbi:Uncharacterised protein [Flavonifractor plautii]|nr:Uncharacterised protein [Flavonifractor plautii]